MYESGHKPSCGAQGVQTTGELPNLQLSLRDYQDFIAALHQVVLAPYTSPRWTAIKALHDRRLKWEGLFQKYVTAYYNGKFVDRTGSVSSKPKLGLTITNETITALESVFFESLWDWAIIGGGFQVPVIYQGADDKPEFLTAEMRDPTLWTTFKDMGIPLPVSSIIEPVVKDDKPGISKSKQCLIKNASGVAGDVAQGTTGMIVRALGGTNVGFTLGLGAQRSPQCLL